jgi:putative peptidoglycan lipid II flippase
MSRLTRISLLLTIFFAFDKVAALIRQVVIARQFGLSTDLDAFNVANNIPDMLYALISGGALAIAFIPILSEVITSKGREDAWQLFSKIANLAFLVTGGVSILVAVSAEWIVRWELGVAPGFSGEQQVLVVQLMRLNLIATLIFSISGLVMAGLQANQHFLLPASAPLLYNLGQIFGALILSPEEGYKIAGFTFPALGLGAYGLLYGVILGACLHLLIQLPGLIWYKFHWTPALDIHHPDVQKVLKLMGPRLITMFFIQLTFLVRDNLASRLETGAVTALTYGWMIMQVPETLIGTAVGTALLPSLGEMFARKDLERLRMTIENASRILIAFTIPVAVVLSVGLEPLIGGVFRFGIEGTALTMWVTRGFFLGLIGHSLIEVMARSFYAQQDAVVPMITGGINLVLYVILGNALFKPLGAAGISLTDSIVISFQAFLLLVILNRYKKLSINPVAGALRGLLAGVVAGIFTWLISQISQPGYLGLVISLVSLIIGGIFAIPIVLPEIKLLRRL